MLFRGVAVCCGFIHSGYTVKPEGLLVTASTITVFSIHTSYQDNNISEQNTLERELSYLVLSATDSYLFLFKLITITPWKMLTTAPVDCLWEISSA